MKILMINKFLYPNGGSETYIFKLGECLKAQGHEVQYFGMEHKGRCVGNRVNAYTSDMDFHNGSKISKLLYPIKTIYSREARRMLRLVLEDFEPDVCHLNNFNYQLTPSVILEIVKWRKQTQKVCKIIYTAHDYQLICPNHMMNVPATHMNCEECAGGRFVNCTKKKCIHGSAAKSIVGTAEAYFWRMFGVYRHIDKVICCSEFMRAKLDADPIFTGKTIMLHNFVEKVPEIEVTKREYILYFGRFSWEKGVRTLIGAARELPDIHFVFAGAGEYAEQIEAVSNITNVGFRSEKELDRLIREARFSICPSECYENCPFSVMESLMRGTPVIGARIGGVPELIQEGITGELFESGNVSELREKILSLWNDREKNNRYSQNCRGVDFDSTEEYCGKLMRIYQK